MLMIERGNSATKMNVVNTIKRMLLSRNTQEQLKAATFIWESLEKFENDPARYTNLVTHFVVNDVCTFLCEASATLQVQLLRNILKCLKIFSTSPIFYKNAYSPQVVTAIVRTIQFLIKENGSETIINNALMFLSEVFFGVNKYEMNPILSKESTFNVLQLFEMMTTILDKKNYETETKLTISLVLHSVIYKVNEDSLNVLTVKTLSQATMAIQKCLELLCQLLIDSKYKYSKENKLDYVFGMLCHISIDSLHFCEITKLLQLHVERNLYPGEDEEKMNKEIIEHTVFDTLSKVVTQIKNFEPMILTPNYDVFLELLNEFLHKQMPHETLQTFAQLLCSNGFLYFLGRLIPSSKKTKKLCLLNLAELLSIMSISNLNLSTWSGGEQNFRRHIFEGLFESGADFSKWLTKLSDVYASDATIHSLIVFVYFCCLNSPSPEHVAAPLLPYLVEYIVNLPNKKCPDPITKCLWLIFAIAYLYNTGYSSIEGGVLKLHKAVRIMAKLVLLRTKVVYTHHAAILLWVFSSNQIQDCIRYQVLELWLRTGSAVPDHLTSVPDLWYSLLEVITQSGEQNSIRVSTDLLKYCLEKHNSEGDQIKHVLWETLPLTISGLVAGNTYTRVESVLCLLELCSTCIPTIPSLKTIQRTASLLPSMVTIFKKKNIDVQFHVVKEAYSLLVASLKQEDKQVLSQFLSSPPLLQLIYDATQSSNTYLSKTALQLLSLSTFYRAKYNLMCQYFVKLDTTSLIISLRDEKENDKTLVILQFLYTTFTLEESKEKSFVILSAVYPAEKYIDTCRALFFRLQMVCCKDSKCESESAWQCLNVMLKSAAGNNSELINVLTSQPWTHKLIAFYLCQNQPSKYHKNFLKFIFNWMTCYKIITGKEKVFHTNKKEMFPVYKKNNILFNTLVTLVDTFSNEEVQVKLKGERMYIVTDILNVISDFLKLH